jgi:hypothetical protein
MHAETYTLHIHSLWAQYVLQVFYMRVWKALNFICWCGGGGSLCVGVCVGGCGCVCFCVNVCVRGFVARPCMCLCVAECVCVCVCVCVFWYVATGVLVMTHTTKHAHTRAHTFMHACLHINIYYCLVSSIQSSQNVYWVKICTRKHSQISHIYASNTYIL